MNDDSPCPYLRTVELARRLGCSRTYLQAMKRAGFIMPGGRASAEEAQRGEWTAP